MTETQNYETFLWKWNSEHIQEEVRKNKTIQKIRLEFESFSNWIPAGSGNFEKTRTDGRYREDCNIYRDTITCEDHRIESLKLIFNHCNKLDAEEEGAEEGAEIPMYRYDDEFGEELLDDSTLDDYLTKADILLKLERKEKALKVLEEVREIAENQNTLDYVKKVENKIKNL